MRIYIKFCFRWKGLWYNDMNIRYEDYYDDEDDMGPRFQKISQKTKSVKNTQDFIIRKKRQEKQKKQEQEAALYDVENIYLNDEDIEDEDYY